MVMGIAEEYEKAKKKYGLPDLKSIEKDFELSSIENTNFLLREIAKSMIEKLELAINVLSDLIQPDTNNLASVHEFRAFDDGEKKHLYDFYSQLMMLHRKGLQVSFSLEEKEEAEYIKLFSSSWKDIKQQMKSTIQKMEQSWKEESAHESELGYLG